jgi:hypothetical protein
MSVSPMCLSTAQHTPVLRRLHSSVLCLPSVIYDSCRQRHFLSKSKETRDEEDRISMKRVSKESVVCSGWHNGLFSLHEDEDVCIVHRLLHKIIHLLWILDT